MKGSVFNGKGKLVGENKVVEELGKDELNAKRIRSSCDGISDNDVVKKGSVGNGKGVAQGSKKEGRPLGTLIDKIQKNAI